MSMVGCTWVEQRVEAGCAFPTPIACFSDKPIETRILKPEPNWQICQCWLQLELGMAHL